MDKEIVFGSCIKVDFRTKTDHKFSYSPVKVSKDSDSSDDSYATNSISSTTDSSGSAKLDCVETRSSHFSKYTAKKFEFPPPPVLGDHNSPSLLKSHYSSQKSFLPHRSPVKNTSAEYSETLAEANPGAMSWSHFKPFCSVAGKQQEPSAFSPFKKDQDFNQSKYSQRNVGRVSPFLMQDCDKKAAKNSAVYANDSIRNLASSSFPVFSSQMMHGVNQAAITVPVNDMPRVVETHFSQWAAGTSSHSFESAQLLPRSAVTSADGTPIELHVSNLDPSFEVNDMKKILLSVFSEHVMVLHISMSLQPDGSAKATVKVPSFQDAQFAISRLHRRKVGHKRILISYAMSDKSPPFHVLKSETIALLNDIPSKQLPWIKFRELYEKRYHRAIAVSELYKMRDVVSIQGDAGNRMVYLNPDCYRSSSVLDSEDSEESNPMEGKYCERHFRVLDSQGWAEHYSVSPLPLVYISLKTLSSAVHMLLDTHQGSLPLISFCDCYEAEIGPLPVVGNVEYSPKEEDSDSEPGPPANTEFSSRTQKGVPLEHLIACVTGVEVAKSIRCFKKVQWLQNKIFESQLSVSFSPALLGQLNLFGREVMDLLKSQSQCLVAFNKFIPTYHHHFGRQCRVADYGFTKLIDLLEAIPHIVQVLGEGQNRQVTLTHRTQVKRFATELLRLLKSRSSKQITVAEFPQVYEQVIEKPFEITNYGVCEIKDLLDEVPESIIVTYNSGNDIVIEIPKREQTTEEIERTKQFAGEVVELMKHTPHCIMSFNKFIPAYHHHFGKQCRVADYGFAKLIELFEALPDILEIKGAGEDKLLHLVSKEQHKVLKERIVAVLKSQPNEVIDFNQLSPTYCKMHGHILRPNDFGFDDLTVLLDSMNSALRMVVGYGKTFVTLVDHQIVHRISLNLCVLLMEKPDGKMTMKELSKAFKSRFHQNIDVYIYVRDMEHVVKNEGSDVQLLPLQLLARDIILVLQENKRQVLFSSLGCLYKQKFGISLCAGNYGFPNLHALVESLPDYFTFQGKKHKRLVCLNADNLSPIPDYSLGKFYPQSQRVWVDHNGSMNSPREGKTDIHVAFSHAQQPPSTTSSNASSSSADHFVSQLHAFPPTQKTPLRPEDEARAHFNTTVINDHNYCVSATRQLSLEPTESKYTDRALQLLSAPSNPKFKEEHESCEDLSEHEKTLPGSTLFFSCKNSPTVESRQSKKRSRLAAHFSASFK